MKKLLSIIFQKNFLPGGVAGLDQRFIWANLIAARIEDHQESNPF